MTIFKIVGTAALVFYLAVSWINPKKYLEEISTQISKREFDDIVKSVLHSENNNIFSYYSRFTAEAEQKITPQTDNFKDEFAEDEDIEIPPEPNEAEKQKDSYDKVEVHPLTMIFGIIFVFGGIYFAFQAVSIYTQQLDERNWTIAMAEVIDVSERQEYQSGGSRHRSHYVTVYDITYQYYTGADSHTGKITGSYSSKAIGERFDIKYDPEYPENSTETLEPRTDIFAFNLAGSFFFIFIGMWVSGLLPRLIQLIKNRKSSHNSK